MQVFFLDPEAVDRARMETQERTLRTLRFMDELKADDAYTFFELLSSIASADNPAGMCLYLAGQMAVIIRKEHHLCLGCGRNHETFEHDAWEAERDKVAAEKKAAEEAEDGEADSAPDAL